MLVRTICIQALMEIGVISQGETPSAADMQTAFARFQMQLESWRVEYGTLAVQRREQFTLTSGSSSFTIGPSGADVTAPRPSWLSTVNYVNPGSNPEIEVPIGIMDRDTFAGLDIKALPSALPLQCFYQTSNDSIVGTLFFWPKVTQNVDIVLYYPVGIDVPVALTDDLLAPPGYNEAFMYQLAVRLMTPFARKADDVPLLLGEGGFAAQSLARIKRPNMQPGQLGMDAAVIPWNGGAYNILSDTYTGTSGPH